MVGGGARWDVETIDGAAARVGGSGSQAARVYRLSSDTMNDYTIGRGKARAPQWDGLALYILDGITTVTIQVMYVYE